MLLAEISHVPHIIMIRPHSYSGLRSYLHALDCNSKQEQQSDSSDHTEIGLDILAKLH